MSPVNPPPTKPPVKKLTEETPKPRKNKKHAKKS